MSEVNNPTEPARVIETQKGLRIFGEQGANRIDISEENDQIGALDAKSQSIVRTFDGDDQVVGSVGKDKLQLGGGDDLGFGGEGKDKVKGNKGDDELYGGGGKDKISGGSGDDTLYGEADNDLVRGGGGNDQIFGGSGNDKLLGKGGDDTIDGGEGNDTIKGGSGDDILIGGEGNDKLTGQRGSDTFVLDIFDPNVPDTVNGGVDTIKDFTPGEDKIGLRLNDASLITDSTGAITFESGSDAMTLGSSTAKVLYNTSTGEVLYNPSDVAGDEMALAKLDPNLDINSTDFEVF